MIHVITSLGEDPEGGPRVREELQSAARRLLHGGSFSEVELWKAGCAEPTKRCLNQRCIGNNKQDWSSAAPLEAFTSIWQEYSACQSDCELQSCGSECQAGCRYSAIGCGRRRTEPLQSARRIAKP